MPNRPDPDRPNSIVTSDKPAEQQCQDADESRFEACELVEELAVQISAVRLQLQQLRIETSYAHLDAHLEFLLHELCLLAASSFAGPTAPELQGKIGEASIYYLDCLIRMYDHELEPLKTIIIPTGNAIVIGLHQARCVANRCKRLFLPVCALSDFRLSYLEHLSNLLFVMARWVGKVSGCTEISWNPRQRRPFPDGFR